MIGLHCFPLSIDLLGFTNFILDNNYLNEEIRVHVGPKLGQLDKSGNVWMKSRPLQIHILIQVHQTSGRQVL